MSIPFVILAVAAQALSYLGNGYLIGSVVSPTLFQSFKEL
jgi:hypothetical protein